MSVAGRQLAKQGWPLPRSARLCAVPAACIHPRRGKREDGHLLTWAERTSDRALFEQDAMMREQPLFDVLVRKEGVVMDGPYGGHQLLR